LQCDGVTCPNDSTDYATYCADSQNQNNGTAAVSQNKFVDFIKKWYAWIIIVAVLVALFVVIFRKLSEKV